MNLDEILEKIVIKQERLKRHLPKKLRPFFRYLEKYESERGLLIYGPRGVGKTVYLLSRIDEMNLLYVSGEDLLIHQTKLYDLAEKAFLEGFSGLVVDEVHHIDSWGVQVKAIYDSFPGKKIWISDSSSVLLRKESADLSRRFVKVRIPLLSFREYLYFEKGVSIEKLENVFDLNKGVLLDITKELDILRLFKDYSSGGMRPLYLEGNYREKIEAMLDKVIHSDIPYFIGRISENHIRAVEAILSFLLYSKIPRINIESFCRRFSLGKEKLYELLRVMEEIDLVNVVRKFSKLRKALGKGKKIFLSDPSLYYVFEGELGNFREAFVVTSFKQSGERIFASEDEREGDFVVDGKLIEVGGKGKRRKGADFVIRDDLDVPVRNSIPMWVLGLLW